MAEQYVTCPGCDKRIRPMRRYPIGPLAAFVGLSPGQTCRHVGLAGSTAKAARCHGLTRQSIETVAAKIAAHPAEIWPEVIDHDIEDASRVCAGDDCMERFIPDKNGHQRYCSARCRGRAQGRRRRSRPSQQVKAAQRIAAWRQANAEEHREYQRRYQRRYMRIWRAKKRAEEAA